MRCDRKRGGLWATRREQPPRRLSELVQDPSNVVTIHLLRRIEAFFSVDGAGAKGCHTVRGIRIGQGRKVHDSRMARRLAPGMSNLNRRHSTLFTHEIGDPAILWNVAVVLDTGTGIGLAANIFDGGLFAEYYASASDRHSPHMDHLPIGRPSIHRMVLAHGRGNDPISNS